MISRVDPTSVIGKREFRNRTVCGREQIAGAKGRRIRIGGPEKHKTGWNRAARVLPTLKEHSIYGTTVAEKKTFSDDDTRRGEGRETRLAVAPATKNAAIAQPTNPRLKKPENGLGPNEVA